MTTRKQRDCLIRLDQVDDVFSDEVCRGWTDVLPRRRRAMPADLPSAVRVRIRAYLEMARDPSGGEINAAAIVLHRRLWKAIEADDWDAAAVALEKVPEAIRAELDRLTPGGIPTPDQLHDAQHGIKRTKELLGCCIAGAEIVPGRERANGRRSRPSLQLRPRFKQARGFPRQEAEAMLVRALAEYYRSLHNSRFPRSWTRDPAKQWSAFERLVGHVLRGCGVSGISPLDLVRRALNEFAMRKAVNDLFPEDRGRKAAYVCLAFADNPEALESRLCLTTTNLSIMTSAIRSRRCIAVSRKANLRTPGDARKDRRTT